MKKKIQTKTNKPNQNLRLTEAQTRFHVVYGIKIEVCCNCKLSWLKVSRQWAFQKGKEASIFPHIFFLAQC